MTAKVKLVDTKGATPISIGAEIIDEGDLLISDQDIGQAPCEMFGDSDYDYFLRIRSPNKDQVLLDLIEKLYGGNRSLVSQLKQYLASKNIPCEFYSYG
jgi:hypothetical protein